MRLRASPPALATAAFVGVLSLYPAGAFLVARQQQQTPQQQPVFRAGVDLVALDVTVVDRTGAPIKDLTADAFNVSIGGQPRPVRTLDYIEYGAGAGTASSASTTSNTVTGATRASQGGRVIVILFDDLSLKAGDAEGLTIAAERMLSALDDDDLVGLTTTSGLGPVVSPTRDRAAIIGALRSKRLVGRNEDVTVPFFVTVKEAVEIDQDLRGVIGGVATRECPLGADPSCRDRLESAVRRLAALTRHQAASQLAAMEQVISALRQVPKPRVLVTLTAGLAVGFARNYQEDLTPISRAAAEADVQFFALGEVGDVVDIRASGIPVPPPYDRGSAMRAENDFLLSGIQTVANAAGGEAFKVIGQAERFFRRIYTETSGVYRLGVESGPIKADQRFLDVKVTLDRPGTTVRAHRHALVPGAAVTSEPVEQQLRNRLAQGGIAFGVPIVLATAVRGGNDGVVRIAVDAQMPASTNGPLIAIFGLVDAKGAMAQSGRRELALSTSGDYRVTFDTRVAPGGYRLRFVVADATGNIGAVQHDVNATLTRFGNVQVSDLLLTWAGADGAGRLLALDALPSGASSLRAAVELYPDEGIALPKRVVRFTLLRADTTAPVAVLDVQPAAAANGFVASATLPAARLDPINYIVLATVLDDGKGIGELSGSFRKVR